MRIDDSATILHEWGTFLEYCHGRLHTVFGGSIPESLLPYPRDEIERALDTMAKRHHRDGDLEASAHIQRSLGPLLFYRDDSEALEHMVRRLTLPGMLQVTAEAMKAFHSAWLAAHR